MNGEQAGWVHFYWWTFGECAGTYIILAYLFVPFSLAIKNYVVDRNLHEDSWDRIDAASCGLAVLLAPISLVILGIYCIGYLLGGRE